MTRILLFDGLHGPRRFELLRTALLNGGDGKSERSAVVIRKEARLLDLLDTISEPTGSPDDRVLMNHGPHAVTVSQDDFDLLQQYAEKTPWTPRAARQAVDLWDWLMIAERRD